MIGAVEETRIAIFDVPCNPARLSVAILAFCGIWTGGSFFFSSRVEEAVHNIVSMHERETTQLGRGGRADCPGLAGVNLFEYHDVVAIGLNVTAVVSLSLLCVCRWLGVCFFCGLALVLVPFNIFSGVPSMFWGVFGALFVLWCGCYLWLIYRSAVFSRFRNLREACRTRPSYAHVQALILVSSLLFSVFLCFPPIPPLWRWSLIATHTARATKVWNSIDGQRKFSAIEFQGGFSGESV